MRTAIHTCIAAAASLSIAAMAQNGFMPPAVIHAGPGAREAVSRAAPEVRALVYQLLPTVTPAVKPTPDASGYVAPAPAIPRDPGVWRIDANGRWVYAAEFTSLGAQYLRLRFGEDLDERAEIFVYDPWTGFAFGPYSRYELARTDFWSTIIFGDSIGIEVVVPPSDQPPAVPSIVSVNHGYGMFDQSLRDCAQHDVSCEPAWQGEADAVCMLAHIQSGGVSGFCTGALLNRTPQDGSPIVMTANHCLGSNLAARPTVYVWFWQTSSCNGSDPNLNALPRSDGSLMLKRHTPSDWNIVGLYEPPASGFYLGWDSNYWEDNSPATGIHHPGAASKRISFGEKYDETDDQPFCLPDGTCFEADVWDIEFSTGSTIPGSSGSPILDDTGVVRGTLSGGPSDECEIARYGRLDRAWVHLRYFLHDVPSTVYVSKLAPGDAGNNGSTERGTATNPFNTVHEATYAVIAGHDIAIHSGIYDEEFVVWRPMTLRLDGTGGVVQIGQ
ncbi:MAG: hypothetical protein H6810_07880 [Phycisphaeraceae bacterium]|nr:MAG: hypothetical protein H6810_07880 [Phycisphaeraceae bacterium]